MLFLLATDDPVAMDRPKTELWEWPVILLLHYLRVSKIRRADARREAGLLLQEHGDDAERVIRAKIRDRKRSRSRSELRLTLYYLRRLMAVRRRRRPSRKRRRA